MGSTEQASNKQYVWNPQVACRTLDGTAFILLKSRMMRLNEVGTRIWELFENGATLDHVAAAITEEFDTTKDRAQADTHAFVEDLLAKELLVPMITSKTGSSR